MLSIERCVPSSLYVESPKSFPRLVPILVVEGVDDALGVVREVGHGLSPVRFAGAWSRHPYWTDCCSVATSPSADGCDEPTAIRRSRRGPDGAQA